MNEQNNQHAKYIFDHIQKSLTLELGPIADILCQEAIQEWSDELKNIKQRRTLRTIHRYVSKLANHINDEQCQQRFINSVYQLDALKHYRT